MTLDERLEELPIFPLPGVHLFPHALLPLHVFEPRYRDLLRDCLAADRVFAVALLAAGRDAEDDARGRPAVRSVCGVGEVIAHEPLPGGRSNILLYGLARARIVAELPAAGRAYRMVRARRLEDRYPSGQDLAPTLRALQARAEDLARRLPEGGDTLRAIVRSHDDPGALSDVLAAAVVTDPGARLALLENVVVLERMEAVTAALAGAIARLDDARGPVN